MFLGILFPNTAPKRMHRSAHASRSLHWAITHPHACRGCREKHTLLTSASVESIFDLYSPSRPDKRQRHRDRGCRSEYAFATKPYSSSALDTCKRRMSIWYQDTLVCICRTYQFLASRIQFMLYLVSNRLLIIAKKCPFVNTSAVDGIKFG